jgi:hypothetical protein
MAPDFVDIWKHRFTPSDYEYVLDFVEKIEGGRLNNDIMVFVGVEAGALLHDIRLYYSESCKKVVIVDLTNADDRDELFNFMRNVQYKQTIFAAIGKITAELIDISQHIKFILI